MSLLIIILAIIPLFTWVSLSYLAMKHNSRLCFVVFTFSALKCFVSVAYPSIAAVFNGFAYEIETQSFSGPKDLLVVLFYENVFTFSIIAPLWFFCKNLIKKESTFSYKIEAGVFITFLIYLLGGIFVYLNQALLAVTNLVDDIIINYLRQFFASFGLLVIGFCIIAPKNPSEYSSKERYKRSKLLTLFALIFGAILIFISITHGIRGRFIYLLESLAVALIFYQRYKPIIVILLLSMFLLPFAQFMGNKHMRQTVQFVINQGGDLGYLFREVGKELETEKRQDGRNFIEKSNDAILERFQGVRNSISLYNLKNSGLGLGVFHNLGAVFYPIPRFIWSGKPVMNSVGLGERSTAINIVMGETYGGFAIYNTGPYLPSAHSYWEWGRKGVIILGLLCGCIWAFVMKLAHRIGNLFGVVMLTSFMIIQQGDPFISMYVNLANLIAGMWQLCFVPFLIYVVVQVINGKRVFYGKRH